MGQHILAIDQGTTSSRSIIFSPKGAIVAIAQQEFSQKYPKDGWVEHDPEEIWESVKTTLTTVFDKCALSPADIASIGITNPPASPFTPPLYGKTDEQQSNADNLAKMKAWSSILLSRQACYLTLIFLPPKLPGYWIM